MRLLLYILSIILSFSLYTCQWSNTYPPAMIQAERYMNLQPDSALHLLESMADTLTTLPEKTQMYYHLLTIQAKDKQYIIHTSDSLIKHIVDFYEKSDNDEHLMIAYYYQGSIYRDMNDAPRALKAFQQAIDLNVPNWDLLAKTYNQMGTLFMYQGLYDEVIRVNRKSIEVYLSQGKINKISYALRDIARMYDVKNMPDSALHYYQKACNTCLSDRDSARYYGILGELGGYYYKIGNKSLAKKTLQTVLEKSENNSTPHIYPFLGYIYKNDKMPDSARYYFQRTLKEGTLVQKFNSLYDLFQLEIEKGNYPQAFNYIQTYALLKDSIDKITQTEMISKINSLYNYQHTEKENNMLKLNEAKKEKAILLLLLAISFIFTISYLFASYQRRKRLQDMEQIKKLKALEEAKYNKSLKAITENNLKIAFLDRQLKDAQKENNQLKQELILAQKESLASRNKEIIATNNEQRLLIESFQQSDIYSLLQRAAIDNSSRFTENDWKIFMPQFNHTFPEFTKHLVELYPQPSIIEFRICCLTKLSFTPTEIARILLRTKSAITMSRTRLYKKIHQTDGSAEKFDEFVKNL